MGNCLIKREYSYKSSVDILYTNYGGGDPGAKTLGSYPDYKLIIVMNVVSATEAGTCCILMKGDSQMGGCAHGTYSGSRTYTWASNGTFSWGAKTDNTNPWLIIGVK